MADSLGVKKHLERFVRHRKDAHDVFSSPLVVDAQTVRKLDEHLQGFLEALRTDVKQHEHTELKRHAKEFEEEVHAELDLLFKSTRQDLLLYQKILNALVAYRTQLRDLLDDPEFATLADSEVGYAEVLLKTADEKLQTLNLLFKKLKK